MIVSQLLSALENVSKDTRVVTCEPYEYDEWGNLVNYFSNGTLELNDVFTSGGLLYLSFSSESINPNELQDESQLKINFPKVSRQALYWKDQIARGRI